MNAGQKDRPNANETTKFWSGIWSDERSHNREASWLSDIRERLAGVEEQAEVKISYNDIEQGIRKMANWKAAGPDGVRGFWFKKFRSLHGVIARSLQDYLDSGEVPEWMVKGRTVLIQKIPAKGTAVGNYRPITCLPLM